MKRMLKHVFRFIVGLDQAFNPLVYGGSEDVTISSQTAFNEIMFGTHVWARRAIDLLFRALGQKHHCFKSLRAEIDEFPIELETLTQALKDRGIEL